MDDTSSCSQVTQPAQPSILQDNEGAPSDHTLFPITTQEQLNKVIMGRVHRERSKYALYAQYKNKAEQYDDLAHKLAEYEEQLAICRHNRKIAEWKMAIAQQTGLPAQALKGETYEELVEHARILQTLLPSHSSAYLASCHAHNLCEKQPIVLQLHAVQHEASNKS